MENLDLCVTQDLDSDDDDWTEEDEKEFQEVIAGFKNNLLAACRCTF